MEKQVEIAGNKNSNEKKENQGEDASKVVNPYKKLLVFQAKPVSVCKLLYSLSSPLDIFLMILGAFGSLGAGVSMPLFAILFGSTITNAGSQLTTFDFEGTIGGLVRNFLIVGAAMFVAYFISVLCWNLAGSRQILKLKELYFQTIMKQEQGWFDTNNAYEFSTKVQAQIKQIEGGLGEKCMNVLMPISQAVSGLVISFTTSWKLTLVLLCTLPFIMLAMLYMVTALKTGFIKARLAYEKAGGIAEEVLYNIKTVTSFANFKYETERFNGHIEESKKIGITNGLKLGAGIGFVFLFMFLTYFVAILYGSRLILDKEWNSNAGRNFQAGDVITVIFSTVMAAASMGILSPNLKGVSDACVAASDFFALRSRIPQIDLSTSTKTPEKESLTGTVEFKNVSFSYPSEPEKKILKNVNLTFESGKKIAIVGESGSGKSTVVNLIERLYDSTEGTITMDGINIRDIDIFYLRKLIGYVQQEPVLFNRSIRDNIIFGRETEYQKNIDELIDQAIEDSYAKEFIDRIDGKLDYVVGVKGGKLSGGQKQRIAIARAILSKPKILLLDEATSALDNKSEKEVQRALDNICKKNVTAIIIAHRLSTIINADKIIAIRNGEVIEQGTHQQLLEKNGYYAGLIKSELDDEEIKKLKQTNNDEENNQDENIHYLGMISKNNLTESARLKSHRHSILHEDDANLQNSKPSTTEVDRVKLFSLLSDNKCNLFLGSLGAAANGCIFPIYGVILATSINALSSTDEQMLKENGFFFSMMFIVIAFSAGICNFFQNYKFTEIGEVLTAKLRILVFEKYMRLHMSYYDKSEHAPGALLTKLSIDTTLLNGIVLTVIGVSVQTVVTLVLGLALGFAYDWRLALICMCFYPFIIISSVMQNKIRRGGSTQDDQLDIEAGSILSECVINTKTIYSYNFQDKSIEMYTDALHKSKEGFVRKTFFISFSFGIGQFALFAAYGTLFYAGGRFIEDRSITFDNMTRAIMSILFSAFGVGLAQQHAGDFTKAKAAFESLFSTIDTETTIDIRPESNQHKRSAKNIQGKIEFRNVSFAYPLKPATQILKNISFVINPGQSVAFVGYSGCGKSTIIQLIERFYDITQGTILIDDVDIKEYNLNELRAQIGLVMQEPCLFKREVKENIRYGKLTASDQEVIEAASRANILKFFNEKEDGTKETPVSGGEKQRIAIARAMVKNPTIILLDEATSALDKESENEVQKALNVLKSDSKTSVTIAHRLSTIENSDVIYVLESGRIVETGTHESLFNMKGKYYNLYKLSS